MTKIGVIACSGEEIPAGTLSRLATRRVLESLRPQSTVTLCLPLFLAGEEQERRFAREHATITVDGCQRLCAKRGTEEHSGRVAASLVVTDVLGDRVAKCHRSARDFDKSDDEAVGLLAERIAAEVDRLAAAARQSSAVETPQGAVCGCSCRSPPPEATLRIGAGAVAVAGLPLIFDRLRRRGLQPGGASADRLLEMVRVYHAVEPGDEPLYRAALVGAYQEFCRSRTAADVQIPEKT